MLRVAPGLRVLLTSPYELILTDVRGSALVLRDDDLKRPLAPKLYEVLRRQAFTRAELDEALDGDGGDRAAAIVDLLTEQAIVVGDIAEIRLGGCEAIPVTLVGDETLFDRMLTDFGPAVDVRATVPLDVAPPEGARLEAALEGAGLAVYAGPVDTKVLESLNDATLAKGVPTLPLLLLSARSALVGPYVVPGRSACLRELLLWMMNADLIPQADRTQMVGNVGGFDSGRPLAYLPLETLALGFLMEMLVEHGRARRAGRLPAYTGRAIFINLERRLLTMESVLRIPGCTRCALLTGSTYSDEVIPNELLGEIATMEIGQ
jgi:hypothetical protein